MNWGDWSMYKTCLDHSLVCVAELLSSPKVKKKCPWIIIIKIMILTCVRGSCTLEGIWLETIAQKHTDSLSNESSILSGRAYEIRKTWLRQKLCSAGTNLDRHNDACQVSTFEMAFTNKWHGNCTIQNQKHRQKCSCISNIFRCKDHLRKGFGGAPRKCPRALSAKSVNFLELGWIPRGCLISSYSPLKLKKVGRG